MTKDTPGAKGSGDPVEMDVDASPEEQRTSRKHLRSSTDEEDLDWSSDESGRFDDAEEPEFDDYKSPSTKSFKRRRSNDWPLPIDGADYGNRNARHGNGGLGASLASGFKSSPRNSPRASVNSLRNKHGAGTSNSPRHRLGRRSRFVEGNMNDSISEKPPSIFMKESKQASAQNRGSGIFRFGKAIASAFNPFGGWGRSSSSPESANKSQQDALTQAEEAYAELKKAGFKGTNKGAYLEGQNVDQAAVDQTWQAVMEKMGYAGAGANPVSHCGEHDSNMGTPMRSPSKSSKRSSFQDLRLGLPLFKSNESAPSASTTRLERTSEDSEYPGLRKQKSKKELSRQAKLLKKVTTLEDKLERARRELRELSGNEERLPSATPESKRMSLDMNLESYPRKFVPGALPTLPSERLLDQQAPTSDPPDPEGDQPTALPSMEGREEGSLQEPASASKTTTDSAVKSPKRRLRGPRPSSMGKESSSLKRKSPVPEPLASRNHPESSPTNRIDLDIPLEYAQLIDTGLLSPPPRQTKWQKLEVSDSPGSVERKRASKRDNATPHDICSMRRRSPSIQFREPSPGLKRSPMPKSKAVRSPPPLRMQRGHSNLRSMSPIKTNTVLNSDPFSSRGLSSSPPAANDTQRSFYMQPHTQLDPDRISRSSPSRPSPSRRHSRREEDIPPVPPLPKELLSSAAKVNRSPTKKRASREASTCAPETRSPSVQNSASPVAESYPWPDDIF